MVPVAGHRRQNAAGIEFQRAAGGRGHARREAGVVAGEAEQVAHLVHHQRHEIVMTSGGGIACGGQATGIARQVLAVVSWSGIHEPALSVATAIVHYLPGGGPAISADGSDYTVTELAGGQVGGHERQIKINRPPDHLGPEQFRVGDQTAGHRRGRGRL